MDQDTEALSEGGSSQSRITGTGGGGLSRILEALSRWHLPQQQPFSEDGGDGMASPGAGLHLRAGTAV